MTLTPDSLQGRWVRTAQVICQHTHPLVIDERRVIHRQEIMDEIKIYLQSGLTMPMIINCCNRKFGLSVQYSAYATVVQKVRQSLHSYIDFNQT